MGRVEDIGVGYGYGVLIGHASPLYGSDRSETKLDLSFNLSQAYQDMFFLRARTDFATRFVKQQAEDSVFSVNIKIVRKNLFLHQTLAAQISTEMQFGLEGEEQVLFGGNRGLRGYASRQFSGDKRIRLNIESRTIFWQHPLIVVGTAIFADVGYIWTGDAFDLGDPKRSVGFGLRVSIPKLSGSRVYRVDLAYPLDGPEKSSFKPVLTYAIGHAF
jgi:outer membrane protein assembly factor BamA